MSAPAANPAGAITLRLFTRDGRLEAVRLLSSRPTDFARRLFAGHPVDRLVATLPRVFSVCATAQASAAAQAVEHAAACEPDPAHVRARELLVSAETAREHLFRILLGWPAWLGVAPTTPGLRALGRMRGAWAAALYPGGDAFRPGGGELQPDLAALRALREDLDGLVGAVLAQSPADWLARWSDRPDPAALQHWANAGTGIAPELLAAVLARGYAGLGANPVPALPAIDDAALARQLSSEAADAFVAAPQWNGGCCETGALARQSAMPLVAALTASHRNALLPRLVARLVELADTAARIARLIDGIAPAASGRLPAGSGGSGVGQVEAARGRLVHWVRLDGENIADYRILAPTEWNFHPQGVLARGLEGLPAGADLVPLAQLLVDAVDPCVESRIEVIEDA